MTTLINPATGTPIATMAWRFLPLFRQIAERHPGLKLVIDHLGLVRSAKRSWDWPPWCFPAR